MMTAEESQARSSRPSPVVVRERPPGERGREGGREGEREGGGGGASEGGRGKRSE
jgi:hypothetical protein